MGEIRKDNQGDDIQQRPTDPEAEAIQRPGDNGTASAEYKKAEAEMLADFARDAMRGAEMIRDTVDALKTFARASAPAFEAVKEAGRAAAEVFNSLPKIDPDTLRAMGETLKRWAQEHAVLFTMLHYWRDINGPDSLPDDLDMLADTLETEAEAAAPGQHDAAAEEPHSEAVEALKFLAARYSDAYPDIEATISDDGTAYELTAEHEARIRALMEDYTMFHSSSGAESYMYTARLFAAETFKPFTTGEIVIRDRLTAISLQDFQFALTTRPNPTAFIAPLGTGPFTRFKYDDMTGQVINAKTKQPVKETQTPAETALMMKTAAESVATPDFVLLTALYSVLLRNAVRFEGDNIIVPIKRFAKELGVDLYGGAGHVKDLEKRFSVYEPYVGWINGHGLFAVLKFIKRDDINGTFTFSAPYLKSLLTLVQQQGTRTYRGGRKAFLGHNELVHTSIYNERNQTAAAVVIHLTDLLLQNRQHPDAKRGEKYIITNVAFSTLADYAELAPRIERTTATREKTRTLKACFTKAFELLRTKSDAYQYFDGLELYTLGKDGKKTFATVRGKDGRLTDNLTGGNVKYNAIAPTFADYGSTLYIRHMGANRAWRHED